MPDLHVKIVNRWYLVTKIFKKKKKGFEEPMMVYVRKSCLSPSNKAGDIPFVPAIPLCLKN